MKPKIYCGLIGKMEKLQQQTIMLGYRMRDKDNLYKIQGTKSLPNRTIALNGETKPCFFVSAVTILHAVLHPLNKWTASRIDKVIKTGIEISNQYAHITGVNEYMIQDISVDEYSFDICIKSFEPPGTSSMNIAQKVKRTFGERHYILLKTPNCTYAIYHDDYYHLFDPYNTIELNEENKKENETEVVEKPKYHKRNQGIKKYCERLTASWILFGELDSLLRYIEKRTENWQKAGEHKLHVVDIITYKKAEIKHFNDIEEFGISENKNEKPNCKHAEKWNWLSLEPRLPVWSRLKRCNRAGRARGLSVTKAGNFDIEIDKLLWSLWGTLSPNAICFQIENRGKQFLACNVTACLAAHMYPLSGWSSQLLDNIVISGDRYHRESLADIQKSDYEFSLEDLATKCHLGEIQFTVHMEHIVSGKLYVQPTRTRMNLSNALMYFFEHFRFGIFQCQQRSLAIGRQLNKNGEYFMFDCQSRDHPIFPQGQGAAYLLQMANLQFLLYCIIATLNMSHMATFHIHKVEILREGADVEKSSE